MLEMRNQKWACLGLYPLFSSAAWMIPFHAPGSMRDCDRETSPPGEIFDGFREKKKNSAIITASVKKDRFLRVMVGVDVRLPALLAGLARSY